MSCKTFGEHPFHLKISLPPNRSLPDREHPDGKNRDPDQIHQGKQVGAPKDNFGVNRLADEMSADAMSMVSSGFVYYRSYRLETWFVQYNLKVITAAG
jgi:hypothetical protein